MLQSYTFFWKQTKKIENYYFKCPPFYHRLHRLI